MFSRTLALLAAMPALHEAFKADVDEAQVYLDSINDTHAADLNAVHSRITDLFPLPNGSEGTPPETIEVPLIPGYSWELVGTDDPVGPSELARVVETTRLPQPGPGQTYRLVIAPLVAPGSGDPAEPPAEHVGGVVA